MGRFNADSITFRGKVGQLCGQRWRSVNVIKTAPQEKYTRTKKQGMCRDDFQNAVLAAQIAQKSCYPCTGFSTGTRSAWNGRVSQAMDKIIRGELLFYSIPVVPLLTPITVSDGLFISDIVFDGDYTDVTFLSLADSTPIKFVADMWYIFVSVPSGSLNDLKAVKVFPARVKSADESFVLHFWRLPRQYIYDVHFYLVSSKNIDGNSDFFWSGFCDLSELGF